MFRQAGVADNREDALDVRVEQTLAQDALPDHARRSEENHFHWTVSYFSRRRIPERVRRPTLAPNDAELFHVPERLHRRVPELTPHLSRPSCGQVSPASVSARCVVECSIATTAARS